VQVHSVSSQSDIANYWPDVHNTAFWSFSRIHVNKDRFDNIAYLLSLTYSVKLYICQCIMGSTSKNKKKTKQGERKYSSRNFRSDLVKINLVCGITLCFCGELFSDETVRIKMQVIFRNQTLRQA